MLDHLCPAMLCRIFRKCIAKGTILGIKTIWHETRLIFSKTIINTFRNSVIIRGIIISWSRSSCQVAVIFAQLTKLWFPWQVFVNQQQYRILWKSTEWEPRCCQQGGRTDRHLTMLICIRFSKLFFIYAPKNRKKSCIFFKDLWRNSSKFRPYIKRWHSGFNFANSCVYYAATTNRDIF